jgi:hypothetical protein
MRVYIDDSGSFSWHNSGVSLFCGVTIPDRDGSAVIERFASWRRALIGQSKRELKGSDLTEDQLASFADTVLVPSDRELWLTVVGIDTRRTREDIIGKLQQQAAVILLRSSELCAEHNNSRLQESYRQMSGWIQGRSPQNLLWIIALQEAVIDSLQHSIIRFMEPQDDSEFHDLRFYIDESFIRNEAHVTFWREWLRAELAKSSRSERCLIPNTWRQRDHPFTQAHSVCPGLLDLRPLFVRRTGFFRSKNFEGLQIADMCAHILYRYHRGTGCVPAYRRLRPRIVGRGGAEIHIIEVNEASLHKDDPRNHVGILDMASYRHRAARM